MSVSVQTGSYALLLELAEPVRIAVGRLGVFDFPAGSYVYTGSAFGPGGLEARVGRHLRGGTALRWHVDYLRAHARVAGVVTAAGRLECLWAQRLIERSGRVGDTVSGADSVNVIAPGFGASDCRAGCPAHLLYFAAGLDLAALRAILGSEGECA